MTEHRPPTSPESEKRGGNVIRETGRFQPTKRRDTALSLPCVELKLR